MCTTLTMPRKRETRRTVNPGAPREPATRVGDGLSPAQRRKIRRVRGAIRSGEYENELKLQVTIDRLLDLLN